MKFKLQFDCDNAAFDESNTDEIARILRDAAHSIEHHLHLSAGFTAPIRDVNGNLIGCVEITGRRG